VFSADGGLLAIVSDANVQVWDLAEQRLTHTIDGFMRGVGSLAFTIDGVNLAVGQNAGVVLRNISTGQIERVFAEMPWNGAIVYSADGRYIAVGGLKTEIRSAYSGQLIHKLEGGGFDFDFSRDSAWLATTHQPYSSDETVELWDTSTGRLIRTLSYEKEYFFDVKISPDDTTVAAGGGGAVVLWDLQTGKSLQNLTDPIDNGAYYTIVFSPDGTILAAGGLNQLVHLWDTRTGELLDTLEVDKGIIQSIAFSPDGQLLAVGSSSGTLGLWDPSRGMLLASLSEHHGGIRRVAFSPNGDILATTSNDDTVRLWGYRS
jgi:WD40 repeat protein